jgi:hypothetical protein
MRLPKDDVGESRNLSKYCLNSVTWCMKSGTLNVGWMKTDNHALWVNINLKCVLKIPSNVLYHVLNNLCCQEFLDVYPTTFLQSIIHKATALITCMAWHSRERDFFCYASPLEMCKDVLLKRAYLARYICYHSVYKTVTLILFLTQRRRKHLTSLGSILSLILWCIRI